MQVYNPTKEIIAQDVHSRNIKLEPGQVRSVPEDVGEVLLRKCKCYGLVVLDYGDKEEATFGSFDAYKRSKAIEGLGVKLQFLNEWRQQESYGIKESIEKNASPAIAMNFKVEEFDAKIKDVQSQVAQAMADQVATSITQKEIIKSNKKATSKKQWDSEEMIEEVVTV